MIPSDPQCFKGLARILVGMMLQRKLSVRLAGNRHPTGQGASEEASFPWQACGKAMTAMDIWTLFDVMDIMDQNGSQFGLANFVMTRRGWQAQNSKVALDGRLWSYWRRPPTPSQDVFLPKIHEVLLTAKL